MSKGLTATYYQASQPQARVVIAFPDKVDDFEVLAAVFARVGVKPGEVAKAGESRYSPPHSPSITAGERRAPSTTLPGGEEHPLALPGGALPNNTLTASVRPPEPESGAGPGAAQPIENPARNRTNDGDGARAPSRPRDVGRTTTHEPTAANREVVRDRAEGSGERELGQQARDDGLDAARRPGVRDSSMSAYRALEWSGKLGKQQQQVLDVFMKDPTRDWTRQELVHAAGLPINAICGRVNELLREPFNVLEELTEKRECRVTRSVVNALVLAAVRH